MTIMDSFLTGLGSTNDQIRDFKHASKLFVDSNYRLAPKNKFLFYVVIGFNPAAVPNAKFTFPEQTEIGQLVKNVDLPKFKNQLEIKNQYNRTRLIQTKMEYEPINITFHDDSANLLRDFWFDYFSYYSSDSDHKDVSYLENNVYKPRIIDRYGLTKGPVAPYLSWIKVYSLHQKRVTEYTLMNPMIDSYQFANHDVTGSSETMETSMSVSFEAVKMGSSNQTVKRLPGFDNAHYDSAPSPLTPGGGSTDSLLGPGGLLSTATSIGNDLFGENPNIAGAIFKGIGAAGNLRGKNIKSILKNSAVDVIKNAARDNAGAGIAFPQASTIIPAAGAQNTIGTSIVSTIPRIGSTIAGLSLSSAASRVVSNNSSVQITQPAAPRPIDSTEQP